MLLGAIGFGLVGGVAGLVIGLVTYPATAWFAVIEVGFPSAVLGGIAGLAAGGVAWWIDRVRHARVAGP
jgi:uncharacterized membrane-anchored protein